MRYGLGNMKRILFCITIIFCVCCKLYAQENGVSVSELQTKLLQKIEELTLYLIE